MVNEEYKIHHIWERIGKIEEKLDKIGTPQKNSYIEKFIQGTFFIAGVSAGIALIYIVMLIIYYYS
jgi:hypothetical protein